MKALIFAAAFSFLACSVEPEPLRYGKDQCHFCKMTLMDRKFGAELVTKKGKVYKFDDVNCMFNFYNGEGSGDEYAHRLVVDFSTPEKLIDAGAAVFLKSSAVKSPMASGIAAFRHEDATLKSQWSATTLSWDDLQKEFAK